MLSTVNEKATITERQLHSLLKQDILYWMLSANLRVKCVWLNSGNASQVLMHPVNTGQVLHCHCHFLLGEGMCGCWWRS